MRLNFCLWNATALFRLPKWCSGKESSCQCKRHKRHEIHPWVGKIPWIRKWQPPVFLPGEFHGQRSLVSFSLWSHKELETTQHTHCFIKSSVFWSCVGAGVQPYCCASYVAFGNLEKRNTLKSHDWINSLLEYRRYPQPGVLKVLQASMLEKELWL